MIERGVHIHKKENPVLLDKVIQSLQDSLTGKLSWLNYAFGRGYKLVEHRPNGNKFVYPAAYVGNGEYVSLLPNDNFGNFSWFDIYDPQGVTPEIQSLPRFTIMGALVFWYDLSSIYLDNSMLYTEEIKDEIIKVLTTPGALQDIGRLTVKQVYERFENIYRGYSLEKVYNQYDYAGEDIESIDRHFFMYPYAGLRIEFEITTQELCLPYTR